MIAYDRLCDALRASRDRKDGAKTSSDAQDGEPAPLGDTSEIDVHTSDIVED